MPIKSREAGMHGASYNIADIRINVFHNIYTFGRQSNANKGPFNKWFTLVENKIRIELTTFDRLVTVDARYPKKAKKLKNRKDCVLLIDIISNL